MSSPADVEAVARERFGWPQLRPGIEDAITGILSGSDTLAVMPTGYGKSAIYQVAGALTEGPTIVVSPLIALQSDQAAGLRDRPDAPNAVVVNSSLSAAARRRAWDEIERGDAAYLFLAPEQFADEAVLDRIAALRPGLFVVDEAHCVSAWGHDFRPDYLRLHAVIERLGHPTVVALTATGSPPVRDEIVERLGMRNATVLTRGFDRPNLRFAVRRWEDDDEKWQAVIAEVEQRHGPGLVYVATRADTERYAGDLDELGLRAAAYHAGLGRAERSAAHERFRDGSIDVMVATTAFGMGIDKPDVRFVLHEAIPDSLDSYYQEAGRAGRDGEPAQVTLHYREEDLGLRSFFASGLPHPDAVARVYGTLLAHGPLDAAGIGEHVGSPARSVTRLVTLLEDAGVVVTDASGSRATASITPGEAADRALVLAEDRERIEQSRIAMMRAYAETRQCRRQFLLGYFGEDLPQPCGDCDTCESGSAYESVARSHASGVRTGARVRHREWGEGIVMRVEDDRLTAFLATEGYRVLSTEALDDGLLEIVGVGAAGAVGDGASGDVSAADGGSGASGDSGAAA